MTPQAQAYREAVIGVIAGLMWEQWKAAYPDETDMTGKEPVWLQMAEVALDETFDETIKLLNENQLSHSTARALEPHAAFGMAKAALTRQLRGLLGRPSTLD